MLLTHLIITNETVGISQSTKTAIFHFNAFILFSCVFNSFITLDLYFAKANTKSSIVNLYFTVTKHSLNDDDVCLAGVLLLFLHKCFFNVSFLANIFLQSLHLIFDF